jgi:hypothetical protein
LAFYAGRGLSRTDATRMGRPALCGALAIQRGLDGRDHPNPALAEAVDLPVRGDVNLDPPSPRVGHERSHRGIDCSRDLACVFSIFVRVNSAYVFLVGARADPSRVVAT